jgi:hypothetical protein
MPEDHLERKTYRKSPGRQYGYEYDPLRNRAERSQSGSTASRSGMLLSQRPDPRRTRQLLRQSIIASKRLDDEMLEDDQAELHDSTMEGDRSRLVRRIHHPPSEYLRPSTARTAHTHHFYDEDEPGYRSNNGRSSASAQPYLPSTRELMREDEDGIVQEDWPQHESDEDEDLDDLEQEAYNYPVAPQRSARASNQLKPRHATTRHLPEELIEQDVDEGYIFEEDEELPPGLHVVKKQSSSRRKFLIGAGALVAGGVGVAAIASQGGPKTSLPLTTNNADKQIKDAYNQGVNQGADQAKRELLTALDNVESYTLQGAIDAALLTRQAYDVFVSPVIKFGAAITGDFLTGMLNAFKVARNWLSTINQDNATLAAIQKVLESWVDQVQNLPKQLDAITQTDLDGAQGYLRALKRKIEADMNALNTPTPTPQQAKPSPTPKKS